MRTFAVYKPYGVLSQFTSEDGHPGLLDLGLSVPKDVWPVGRLDRDSEGLLLLTNDNHLKRTLTEPERSHRKTYWVQVEGLQLMQISNHCGIQCICAFERKTPSRSQRRQAYSPHPMYPSASLLFVSAFPSQLPGYPLP